MIWTNLRFSCPRSKNLIMISSVSSVVVVILASMFVSLVTVSALKLTLNQDLMELPRNLSPDEIGQFLHSIKNLPKLAEYLDPSRSRINFDLFFYYNNYGCGDVRVFNWDRINTIMTYGRLCRKDRLILLNGECLMNWPDLLKVEQRHNLSLLLELFPEINPLLQVAESDNLDFWWHKAALHRNGNLTLLLKKAQAQASKSGNNLNFIPHISRLFMEKLIRPEDLINPLEISPISLIGPDTIEFCYSKLSLFRSKQKCSSIVFGKINTNYIKFSAKDLFFWSLNMATAAKYDPKPDRLRVEFDKLLRVCHRVQVHVIKFITEFGKLILGDLKDSSVIVLDIFKYFCSTTETHDTELPAVVVDPMFLAAEFYKWSDSNKEHYNIPQKTLKKSAKLVHKTLSKRRSIVNSNYYLNFLVSTPIGFQVKPFREFLQNNFDPDEPSTELLKAFRNLSWSNDRLGMLNLIRSFLDVKVRTTFLRKVSFDHPNHYDSSSAMSIYISDENPISQSIFEEVYETLLQNFVLVFPLKIDVNASSFSREFVNFSKLSDLKTILQMFWSLLASFPNGFFQYSTDEDADDDDEEEVAKFVPNPWTHPNILFATGCVMTLAFLHGIKLENWSIKRSIFNSAFSIILQPPTNFKKEEHFLTFFTLNDFNDQMDSDLNIKTVSSGVQDLLSFEKQEITRKYLKNYQQKLLKSKKDTVEEDSFESYDFSTSAKDVWISKMFMAMELIDSKKTKNVSKALRRYLPDFNYAQFESNMELLEKKLDDDERADSDLEDQRVDLLKVEMAEAQIYSIYLGLQPLTRFLKAEEVYDTLFSL